MIKEYAKRCLATAVPLLGVIGVFNLVFGHGFNSGESSMSPAAYRYMGLAEIFMAALCLAMLELIEHRNTNRS